MTVELPDLASAIRWFRPLWEERLASVPTRLHVHEVEPDSRLGSPKLAPAFLAHLAASAHDVVVLAETRDCHHRRLESSNVYACPDCGGGGTYQAERVYYRDPMASALDALHRRPDSWPRGFIAPDRLVLELVAHNYAIATLARDLVVREAVLAEFALLAFRRLANRYREAPPTRLGWVDKSDAQQAAETAA